MGYRDAAIVDDVDLQVSTTRSHQVAIHAIALACRIGAFGSFDGHADGASVDQGRHLRAAARQGFVHGANQRVCSVSHGGVAFRQVHQRQVYHVVVDEVGVSITGHAKHISRQAHLHDAVVDDVGFGASGGNQARILANVHFRGHEAVVECGDVVAEGGHAAHTGCYGACAIEVYLPIVDDGRVLARYHAHDVDGGSHGGVMVEVDVDDAFVDDCAVFSGIDGKQPQVGVGPVGGIRGLNQILVPLYQCFGMYGDGSPVDQRHVAHLACRVHLCHVAVVVEGDGTHGTTVQGGFFHTSGSGQDGGGHFEYLVLSAFAQHDVFRVGQRHSRFICHQDFFLFLGDDDGVIFVRTSGDAQ